MYETASRHGVPEVLLYSRTALKIRGRRESRGAVDPAVSQAKKEKSLRANRFDRTHPGFPCTMV